MTAIMERRLRQVEEHLDKVALEDREAVEANLDPELKRYLLIEESSHYGRVWLTSHDSPADAAHYHDADEYPGDWDILRLVDLDTGQEYLGVQTTTFIPD